MPKKSQTSKVVRKSAADIPATSATDLARLRAALNGPIDTSDIPEHRGQFSRLERESDGRLPRKSLIRDAIARELQQYKMTPYRLWKEARVHCPTLSQPAVYEFLKGQRQLELPYAEALMAAVHLGVARVRVPKRSRAAAQPKHAGSSGRPKRKSGTDAQKKEGETATGDRLDVVLAAFEAP